MTAVSPVARARSLGEAMGLDLFVEARGAGRGAWEDAGETGSGTLAFGRPKGLRGRVGRQPSSRSQLPVRVGPSGRSRQEKVVWEEPGRDSGRFAPLVSPGRP
jgi:hypothetical protein